MLHIGCVSTKDESELSEMDSVMIDVFVDVNLINARTELGFGTGDILFDSILSYHGLSPDEYTDRIEFYSKHPDTYLAVLNEVNNQMAQESRSVSGF
ncbi:MAG: DUF4296 domain-containing protein [Bacteroidetes bacterium]|nr:DUF4296 domain-containing protein [Bacteroidota bacterium]